MKVLSKNVIYHGRDEPLPKRVALQAGPVSLFFEEGDLRYLRLGPREIIRRIYVAVRDQNWTTIPARLSNVDIVNRRDSFRIFYEAEHRFGNILFTWRSEVLGEPSGRIVFTMDGQARSTFLKNRIGICVLHPSHECAGARCRVQRAGGNTATAQFPQRVAAEQPVSGFTDLITLAHEDVPGRWIEVKFSGELFEMEDQRNWIDASYKTYCTPLRLPHPVEIRTGQRVHQQVAVEITGDTAVDAAANEGPIEIDVDPASARPLPKLGFGISSSRQPLSETAACRLAQLGLSHLRVDLKMSADWREELGRARAEADAINVPLEVAIFLPREATIVWPEVRLLLHQVRRRVARFIVFSEDQQTTSARALGLARQHLADFRVPIGAGTNADFYQLNQVRPPQTGADFISWSINPQVHAFDLASLAETPPAVRAQIDSAREYFPGKALVVSPLTLKPRFNPVATGPEPPLQPGELPRQVDPRQMSLFGAAWTLAAYKHLAESALESVTFYETAGWRGVLETDEGSPLSQKFSSVARGVFPMFHVFADIAEFAGGDALRSASSRSLTVDSLLLRKQGRIAALIANLTDVCQVVRLKTLKHSPTRARVLDESSADLAMRDPDAFRDRSRKAEPQIELPPFAYCRLDFE